MTFSLLSIQVIEDGSGITDDIEKMVSLNLPMLIVFMNRDIKNPFVLSQIHLVTNLTPQSDVS